jgi:oxygen-independent coproporphyrinogen-3 oxidase
MNSSESRTGKTAGIDDGGFGLYLHWPFCLSKCPYCDFNSHVRDTVDQARWRAALLRELDHYASLTPGRVLGSIFLGGGTPSLMAAETVAALIERAARHWSCADDIEITLEANPSSVESKGLADYRHAGVNRVSLGVQSFDDAELRFLGRRHGAAEAMVAIDNAQKLFRRVSFDLIYARPRQTVAAWRAELATAINFGTDHLSVYQLTIEPDTAFAGAHRRGEIVMPDEDTAAALFEVTQETLEAAGLPAYEISNHARPGQECRHNLTYWRYGDYVGVGPGAHGRLTIDGRKLATRQHRAPEAWLAAVESAGHATRRRAAVEPSDRLNELTLMGLRLREGIRPGRLLAEGGVTIESAYDADRLRRLIDGGFLVRDEQGLRATRSGRQRLNAVIGELLA